MATANEMGYREGTNFNYFKAGFNSKNMTVEKATDNFDELASQYGVNSGEYGSWDNFWGGYYGKMS